MLFRPTELRAFLNELGIDAKKGLSQNFLIDGNILQKICTLADIRAGDRVLEIGPGPGALTEALLQRGAHVTAIEMDGVLAKMLGRLDGDLKVVEGDALTIPIESLLEGEERWKVVANLPYHITTPILALLAPLNERISSITVMVQKEVARRFIAKKNTADYSSFTLFLQFYGAVRYGFTVEPTCFYPRPKVQSAVVKIDLKPFPQVVAEDFFRLTRTAFKQRRKMLRASLKELYGAEQVEWALASLSFPNTTRPEDLSLDNFLDLFKKLHP